MKGKVVKASLTPALIQKTSFGEISGKRTKRVKQLESLFRKAKVPYEICPSMEEWQLCHLALVVPLGDAIREGKGNHLDAAGNQQLMKKTTRRIKRNLYLLQKKGVRIIPQKLKCLSSGLDLYFRSYKIVLFKDWRNLYLSSCTLCGAGNAISS